MGLPGFVRPCHYVSDLFKEELIDINVSNTRSGRYTLINVNGLDIYFNRYSGKIDGVGGHCHAFPPREGLFVGAEKD